MSARPKPAELSPREQFMRAYAAMAIQAPVPNLAGYERAKADYTRRFAVTPEQYQSDMGRLARMHGV